MISEGPSYGGMAPPPEEDLTMQSNVRVKDGGWRIAWLKND